jgi:16S rRNA (guanine527-N7)-methyltransferase
VAITPAQINEAAAPWGLISTAAPVLDRLAAYGNLLLHWNARFALTAIRDESELIERHLMEGVFAAAHHPEAATALDFGSGTGVPGIVIAVCRPELRVTLAESQRKKAAFLAEAVRQLGLSTTVHAGRAENLPPASFDAVWMRAVEKSGAMLPVAASLVSRVFHVEHPRNGWLCLFGTETSPDLRPLKGWRWERHPLPGSSARILYLGQISRVFHVEQKATSVV